MTLDKTAGQPGAPLPAGWAFGNGSIRPHWFDAGRVISACGKANYYGLVRNPNAIPKYAKKCQRCEKELAERVTYE